MGRGAGSKTSEKEGFGGGLLEVTHKGPPNTIPLCHSSHSQAERWAPGSRALGTQNYGKSRGQLSLEKTRKDGQGPWASLVVKRYVNAARKLPSSSLRHIPSSKWSGSEYSWNSCHRAWPTLDGHCESRGQKPLRALLCRHPCGAGDTRALVHSLRPLHRPQRMTGGRRSLTSSGEVGWH